MTATNSLNGFRLVDSSALADPASFLDQATDIPASLSLWTLPVEAGISGQTLTFFTKSFVDPDETITINGNVHASASLPTSRRGVHMFRMVSAIDNVSGREWSSFALLLKELVTLVARLQDLPTASIDLMEQQLFIAALRYLGFAHLTSLESLARPARLTAR